MDVVAARIIVRGRVQGVGYRWFARDAAESLAPPDAALPDQVVSGQAVSGWVRNLRDGRVALLVEGDAAEVERFLRAVREHWGSLIADEQIMPAEPAGRSAGLQVVR